jgi:hypothetical protein
MEQRGGRRREERDESGVQLKRPPHQGRLKSDALSVPGG